MSKQHIKLIKNKNNFAPKEGQRDLMCCNKKSLRCPSFGINSNLSQDASIDYLAKILVEAFLDKKEYDSEKEDIIKALEEELGLALFTCSPARDDIHVRSPARAQAGI